uniref:Immunoglobulin V-set domain-containing protein n=1 Tax=Oryzias latipes TaxID=8090 RepID=A0A3B3INX2_ORYLA
LIIVHFEMLYYINAWHNGVSALTPVFVQTGNDLLLDANGADCSEDGVLIFWRFNEKDNLVRLTCHKDREPTVNKLKYPERTEITEKTSLKLKNCREDFTGVYSAIRISDENEVVAKYNVTVKDPVSPAHLKVDSVFNSSDVCNLTVTCSTDHSSVSSSFTCGKETCKQDNGQQTDTSQQGNVLHVYLSDESVICNHSNQVSWANSTKRIELICLLNYGTHTIPSSGFGSSLCPSLSLLLLLVVLQLVFLSGEKDVSKIFCCDCLSPKVIKFLIKCITF